MKRYLFVVALAGCVDGDEVDYGVTVDELSSQNGLSLNGRSLNGRSLNGSSLNGTALNGLVAGLSSPTFRTWFDTNPAENEIEMRYVVKCARASNQTTTWTHPVTLVKYTWPGLLGLATGWTNRAMTVAEQQVLTACLFAHANKYGLQIPISIQGQNASGTALSSSSSELQAYPIREAAFFGNAAVGEGPFVCLENATYYPEYSSARACGYDTSANGTNTLCPPLWQVGACSSFCVADSTKTYYKTCTYNGKTYKPLATRLRWNEVFRCGDGTCQFTEKCGTGTTYNNCRADCGTCPAP